jgi:hypothetical protein
MAMKMLGYIAPPNDSIPFEPTRKITIAPGATETLEFRGPDGNVYGFDRIQIKAIGATDDELLLDAEKTNQSYLFQKVTAAALNRLFYLSNLQAPITIEKGHHLKVHITNNAATAATVFVMIKGMNAAWLERIAKAYQVEFGAGIPTARFHTAYQAAIAPGTSRLLVPIKMSGYELEFRKIAVASTLPDNVELEVRQQNRIRKELLPVSLMQQEYEGRRSAHVWKSYPNENMDLYLSNNHPTLSANFSWIAEAYEVVK